MLELDGLGEVIGHDAAMKLAVSTGVPIVSMAERNRQLAETAKQEADELEEWFADGGTPAVKRQNCQP